jgi:Terminase large subunit, T4likevirus-type, N-terminal
MATPNTPLEFFDILRGAGVLRGDSESWSAWRSFIAALFGLLLTDDEFAIYHACTGRTEAPTRPASEGWLVVGRRGGKSFALALIAVYLAAFRDYRAHLSLGERALVMVMAADQRQAKTIKQYISGLFRLSPLARLKASETADSIVLRNGVTVEIFASSFRSVRGFTVVAALCDELAFWRTDEMSANPDAEVISAIRPAMATVPNGLLLCASSPHARRGELWNAHRKHFGVDGDRVLVWQAPTRTMNPSVPQSLIDEALEADPARAAAEYLAQFRTDVESFLSREAVDACVEVGCRERAPAEGVRYFGFCDPSGGSSDSMTLAIAHRDGDAAVLDCLRERRPPFSPEAVVAEFSATLRSYGVLTIRGDRYSGEWVREAFRKCGIDYLASDKTKSEIYLSFLPLVNSGRAVLLDEPRTINQLCGLERRTARGGRDSVDHPPGGRDDAANAAAGALVLASARAREAVVAPLVSVVVPAFLGDHPGLGGELVDPATQSALAQFDAAARREAGVGVDVGLAHLGIP